MKSPTAIFTSLFLWQLLALALPAAAESVFSSDTNAIQLSRETMTPEQFREIVATPGDATPLAPRLAAVPLWPNTTVSNVMTYASGKVFQEVMVVSARTVQGKYVVFKAQSRYYGQTINAILAVDPKTSTLKNFGLYGDGQGGDTVTEGAVNYDFKHKTYAITSSYGDFKETTTGSYTDTEDVAKTVVYKDGALFMTRVVVTRPAPGVRPLSVLYIGNRPGEFAPLLKAHFARVDTMTLGAFHPGNEAVFDVVLLDWPQSGQQRGAWLDGAPLGRRENWHKPTVLLGSAGLNLAVAWKLYGGSGCTCLAPVAYNLRPHEIFQSPLPVDIAATTEIPVPEQFVPDLKTNTTIAVLPLVDGITNYRTVINDHARGWSSHYYEYADMPDVEVFSGGINEQTPKSAAFWRQGDLLHFGFEQSPAQLNAAGQAMLVNAIVYISHFKSDRPIGVTRSVFGPERVAVTRDRAKGYFAKWPREVTNVLAAATLATFDWHNAAIAQAWFATNRAWISPDADNYLALDAEAQALNVVFDAPDFFPKAIAALREDKTAAAAAHVLARYAPEGPGAGADAAAWEKWWHENAPYLFYSELAGYRWYVDPLAKQRGVPSKELRGPLRADK